MSLPYHRLGRLVAMLVMMVAIFALVNPGTAAGEGPTVIPGNRVSLYAADYDANTRVPADFEAMGPNSPATATIDVTYNGFTPESQAAFEYAVTLWESTLNSNVNIKVIATWESLPTGVLGSAGPSTFLRDWTVGNPPPSANTWYPAALANKIAGVDLTTDGTGHDIEASFNSTFSDWYFGTDGNTPPGKYDFVSVVLHELGHGLGFSGSARVTGGQGSWGAGSGYAFVYDRSVVNGSAQSILDTTLFPNPSAALAAQLQGNNLFLVGAGATTGNGGTPPKLYAPNPWQQGSSYSHLDEATFPAGNPNSLMTPQLAGGEAIHSPGNITRGLFNDMGWTVDATAVTLNDIDTTSANSFPFALVAGLVAGVVVLVALRRTTRG